MNSNPPQVPAIPDFAALLGDSFFQEEDLILRIRDLNPHIVCALCAGYFIDATTISECSHTCMLFCVFIGSGY